MHLLSIYMNCLMFLIQPSLNLKLRLRCWAINLQDGNEPGMCNDVPMRIRQR